WAFFQLLFLLLPYLHFPFLCEQATRAIDDHPGSVENNAYPVSLPCHRSCLVARIAFIRCIDDNDARTERRSTGHDRRSHCVLPSVNGSENFVRYRSAVIVCAFRRVGAVFDPIVGGYQEPRTIDHSDLS